MGANLSLTIEQHNKVLAGRAICNDRYVEYPEGTAVACFHGCQKLERNLSQRNKLPMFQKSPGKICTVQSAVQDMMKRLHAEDLYREFMAEVFALIDCKWICDWNYSWRKALLSLRIRFAPRFFAHGMDVWVCKDGFSEDASDDSEYWMVFVDRSIADPVKVKALLRRDLIRGMGTGIGQKDVAPFIEPYLQQLEQGKPVNKLAQSISTTAIEHSEACFALFSDPPSYKESPLEGSWAQP